MRLSFARVREGFLRALHKAGWLGVSGATLFVLSAIALDLDNLYVKRERTELSEQRAELMRIAAGRFREAGTQTPLDGKQGFPAAGALSQELTRLYDLAGSRGLNVDRAAYRRAEESGTPFERVSLQLPVRGSYSAVYGWLQQTLETMPEMALESFAARRVDVESDLVEAEVRLHLFLRRMP